MSLAQIRRTGQPGYGLGLAGLILGYVWLGVIVLLVALSVPVYVATVDDSKRTAARVTVSRVITSVTAWSAMNSGELPTSASFADTDGMDGSADLGHALPSDRKVLVAYGAAGTDFCVWAAYEGVPGSAWYSYDGSIPTQDPAFSSAAPTAPAGTVAECPGIALVGV